jgi:hypothetical protein
VRPRAIKFILPAGIGASMTALAGSTGKPAPRAARERVNGAFVQYPPGGPTDHLRSIAELAFDAVRGEALTGRGEAFGSADMVPLAIVHDRAQAARGFGAVEEPNQ